MSTGTGIAIAVRAAAVALVIVWPRVVVAHDTSRVAREHAQRLATVAAREKVQRDDAVAAIERVQADYGTLLSDVAYVIENHALFDARFEPTRKLDDTLWIVQQTRLETLDIREVLELSAQLSLAFRSAKRHAEKLGLAALGQHAEKGRRAGLLARKAACTESEHEHRALMESLQAILDTIGVVLPIETTTAIAVVRRKVLEGW